MASKEANRKESLGRKPSTKFEQTIPVGTPGWNPWYLIFLIWIGFLGYQYFIISKREVVDYSRLIEFVEQGQVKRALVAEDRIEAQVEDDTGMLKTVVSVPVEDPHLVERLSSKGVSFTGVPKSTFWDTFFLWLLPILFMVFLWRMFFKKLGKGFGEGLLPVGKSKARVYVEKDIETTFDDVAGVDEAKEELKEIVDFLKYPKEYERLGGRAPKGVLLVGPPGTGKTLLAKAVAGEANVLFYSINGSEFVELFVGMGAARVRDLFEQARKHSPCIIFIDELDALGRSRASGMNLTGASDEKEQTLNQLLAELDGFDSRSGIILLAATNRPEILDPALLRSGRFDRQILIDKPEHHGRSRILAIHVKKIQVSGSVDLDKIASMTPGFTGADLENLVNEAALVAIRRKGDEVVEQDFVKAIERIVAGPERRNRLINPEEKRRVAYHEMGHVAAALALNCFERVQKVSVIPRGIGALGYTLQRPTEDRVLLTQSELERKISVLLGGRVSEQHFLGEISTGSSDDLVKATNIARAMVTQYSMSSKVGLATYEQPQYRFLEGSIAQRESMSDETSRRIDEEIKAILVRAEETTKGLIAKHQKFVESGVVELLRNETLDEKQIEELWAHA